MSEHRPLIDIITKGLAMPDGSDEWGMRSVHPDFRSSHGFRWPWPGQWAEAPGPIDADNTGPCPSVQGDGLCTALTPQGMASGRIPALAVLVTAHAHSDVLGRDADKVRVRLCRVVELVDLPGIGREGRLDGADLRGANLYGANLWGADLRGANLWGANLWGANLYGADLRGANLRGANLDGADLRGAHLRGAHLRGANLYGANLRGAHLRGADLWGANLYGANLRGANLRGANLYGADLRGANLRGANLDGANLYGANLRGADLRGAHLRGAYLWGANHDRATTWPDGFTPSEPSC